VASSGTGAGVAAGTAAGGDPFLRLFLVLAEFSRHGLRPVGFAYPAGAFNTTIETEVQSCGYGNARTAGSLSPAGPTYAETLPPKNWLALRAYAPGGQVTLANLESLVSGAASHGGGWVPAVMQKVCSQALDPANYATCTSASGWVDLADLNAFLSWVQNAGQAGGARWKRRNHQNPDNPDLTGHEDTTQPV
jgi:hypothetical protein